MAKDVICKGTFDTDSNQSKKSVCNPLIFTCKVIVAEWSWQS